MTCALNSPIQWFVLVACCAVFPALAQAQSNPSGQRIQFRPAPEFPDPVGVAGPVVGVHQDVLIVAGGAHFALPGDAQLWSLPKRYVADVRVMRGPRDPDQKTLEWQVHPDQQPLSAPVAYGACVSTPFGVLCLGGEDQNGPTRRAFLLQAVNDERGSMLVRENDQGVPDLPLPATAGGAAVVGDYVYLVAGQVEGDLKQRKASRILWRLNLATLQDQLDLDVNDQVDRWEPIISWPETGPQRMFPLVAAQHDGFGVRLYVFGGRYFPEQRDQNDIANLTFLSDGWSFDPQRYDAGRFDAAKNLYQGETPWKRLGDSPVPLAAGTAVPFGPAHVVVPAYATGSIIQAQLKSGLPPEMFPHPGFPRTAYGYHTITDTWAELGATPANQVTTPAVVWNQEIFLVSGEIQPRVRSNRVWRISIQPSQSEFGALNMSVVVIYLIAMVLIGVYFSRRNRSTDDYFRGGNQIPWWAAGCSIFATMLSSITYMAIPAKAFSQDWVYAVGNVLILAVAPIAIYLAMPFYRRLDVTSAYEYLERRFNRTSRWIGSASFGLFHVFRMGVVLALAALALASVTPLTPTQCVYVMGILSIVYCTLGGIEAVIWTDTVQTFILLGGAILCLVIALNGADAGSWDAAQASGKLHWANLDFGNDSFMTMAIWVVVLGSVGQNVASYTADQAVVQRYLTTSSESMAARSIWLNGVMAIPSVVIFFGMGTAFWMFYRSHPEKLDPTMAADQILPLFIAEELPVGFAGLVVAGIFAAAQSTVSTSMNSGATTIVTDFIRPWNRIQSEQWYLWLARGVTLAMGILGTLAGLLFVDPAIKSLFDQFIGLLGMFLGVLAGLFALGATTRRANGKGSLVGAAVAMAAMAVLVTASQNQSLLGWSPRESLDSLGWRIYRVPSYLYAFIGIGLCYTVGYVASRLLPEPPRSLTGLTLWDRDPVNQDRCT